VFDAVGAVSQGKTRCFLEERKMTKNKPRNNYTWAMHQKINNEIELDCLLFEIDVRHKVNLFLIFVIIAQLTFMIFDSKTYYNFIDLISFHSFLILCIELVLYFIIMPSLPFLLTAIYRRQLLKSKGMEKML
jgi:hypothetical protein